MAYTNITKLAIDDKLLDVDAVVEQAVNQRMGNIIDMIHPVGDTIIRLDNINPATLYAGTTWQLVSQGKAIIGANSSYPLGSEGGSADAVVVSHTHTQNAHNHTQNSHNHTQNAHSHKPPKYTAANKNGAFVIVPEGLNVAGNSTKRAWPSASTSGNYLVYTTPHDINGAGLWEVTDTATTTATNNSYTATNNPYTATNNPTGVDGTGKNLPPYKAFNIWLRTA